MKQLVIGIMQKYNTEAKKKINQKSYFYIHKVNTAF